MNLTRREFKTLLPLLLAQQAAPRERSHQVLPSAAYEYSALPVKTNPETHAESRAVFNGDTHGGFRLECHMTKLPPGAAPHPPHRHVNEEVFFLREGTMEITVEGKAMRIGPGSVAYIASNELHGARNVGANDAQYFVLELHGND